MDGTVDTLPQLPSRAGSRGRCSNKSPLYFRMFFLISPKGLHIDNQAFYSPPITPAPLQRLQDGGVIAVHKLRTVNSLLSAKLLHRFEDVLHHHQHHDTNSAPNTTRT